MLARLYRWIDERTGWGSSLEATLHCPIAGGSRWSRTLGPLLLMLFLVEAATGIGLSFYYSPSSTDAWASVNHLQTQVPFGWWVRGLHRFSAWTLVVVGALHLAQTFLVAAYRRPRELTWVLGVCLLLLAMAIAHTGMLLPADLQAYWSTQVLLGLTEGLPLLGPAARRFLEAGETAGSLTLTRLYALHAFVLPLLFVAGFRLHAGLRQRHGAAIPQGMPAAEATARAQPYAPFQLSKDLLVMVAVLGGLTAYTVSQGGAELHAPGDPSVDFVARPEWFLLPIYRLRLFFPASLQFVATAVLPGLFVGFVIAIPFLHEWLQNKTPRGRWLLTGGLATGLSAAVALGLLSRAEDRANPTLAEVQRSAAAATTQAKRLAALGVPAAGPSELYKNDPVVWGQRVFARKCGTCHKDCSQVPYRGDPCLEGYATRTWLTAFLRNPQDKHFFGNTEIDEMDAYDGPPEKLPAIVEFLYSQGDRPDVRPDLAKLGEKAYEAEGCAECHSLDGEGTGKAPDLKGYASKAWLSAFIREPGAARFYGGLNAMDEFPLSELSDEELEAVIAFLRAQTDAQAKFPQL